MIGAGVVIAVHNGQGLIARTVRSVLAQENVDFGLVVVDDGSDDGTLDELASFTDRRLRVLRLPRRRGVSAARNAGLSEVGSEYVAFIDAGDSLLPCALEKLLAAAPGNDVVIGGYRLDAAEDLSAIDAVGEEPFPDGCLHLSAAPGRFRRADFPALLNVLLDGDLLHPISNKLYRRGALGGTVFDENVFCLLEDELFNLEAFGGARRAALIPDAIAFVNTTRPGSLSIGYDDDRPFNLVKLARGYESLLAGLGRAAYSALAPNCDRQLMFHFLGLLANLKKALPFAHSSAMMYEAERLLDDPLFSGIAGRSRMRREMLASVMNMVADHIFPALRRRSFIVREHGNGVEHMADILIAARFNQTHEAESLVDAAAASGAGKEDVTTLASKLWSEFDV